MSRDLLSGLRRLRLVKSSSCLLLSAGSAGSGVQSSMLSGEAAPTVWVGKARAGTGVPNTSLQDAGAGVQSSMLTTCLLTAGVQCSGAWIRLGSDSAPDVNRNLRMVLVPISGTWNVKLTLGQRPGSGRL